MSGCAPVENVRGGGTRQARVQATIWHPKRCSCRLPVDVLTDTAAGGGKLCIGVFFRSVEQNAWWGGSIIGFKDKGLLRVVNPI